MEIIDVERWFLLFQLKLEQEDVKRYLSQWLVKLWSPWQRWTDDYWSQGNFLWCRRPTCRHVLTPRWKKKLTIRLYLAFKEGTRAIFHFEELDVALRIVCYSSRGLPLCCLKESVSYYTPTGTRGWRHEAEFTISFNRLPTESIMYRFHSMPWSLLPSLDSRGDLVEFSLFLWLADAGCWCEIVECE
jgi:hypothetical protein